MKRRVIGVMLTCVCLSAWMAAQLAGSSAPTAGNAVPNVINYSGVLTGLNGKPLTGIQGVTFLLYGSQEGGNPLWMETQNLVLNRSGQYSATIGVTTSHGLPADLFANGEARWLAVQAVGQTEQPRVLLVAVPYALKASDADTIGGLPASAFVLANAGKPSAASKTPANPDVTGVGTVDFIPMWDTTSDIVDSVIFQKSSDIGIGTTSPAALLDVAGKGDVRDTLTLFPKSTDNTLAVSGTTFAVSSTGKVTFINGQTFPGTGTITGITTASGSGLSGGGTTGTLTLKIPAAGVTNAMLANSKVTVPVTAPLTGGGAVTLGGTATAIALKPCAANQAYLSNGTTWSCATAGTGTITGITTASGSGLTGGGTSGTLSLSIPSGGVTNAMLQHDSVTVSPGTDLIGGGTATLGGSAVTLNLDTTKVPTLAGTNTFTTNQTISGPSSAVALNVNSSGNISEPQVQIVQNNTSDYARLRLTAAGSTNYWDVAGYVGTGGPQLNFWNAAAGLNLLQLFPTSVQTNATLVVNNAAGLGTGDGVDVSGTFYGLNVTSSSFDAGYLDAPSGALYGSFSQADSDSFNITGAVGLATGATQETFGVSGFAASPIGVGAYAGSYYASSEGESCCAGFYSVGLWADTSGKSSTAAGIAALTTVDDGYSVVSYSNSSYYTTWIENDSTVSGAGVLSIFGGNSGKQCWFDNNANLTCDGSISPAVPVAGGAKKVAMYGVSAAESWFEDAGGGQLSNGSTIVQLDPTFAETVNTGVEYRVFLTPNGDCKGLYVNQKTATSFEVHELGGGTSNISFDYRIMAKRRGFESARMEDKTAGFGHGPIRRPSGERVINPTEALKAHMEKAEAHRKASMKLASATPLRK